MGNSRLELGALRGLRDRSSHSASKFQTFQTTIAWGLHTDYCEPERPYDVYS